MGFVSRYSGRALSSGGGFVQKYMISISLERVSHISFEIGIECRPKQDLIDTASDQTRMNRLPICTTFLSAYMLVAVCHTCLRLQIRVGHGLS